MDARLFSLIVAAGFFLFALHERRVLVSWSLMGVFWLSQTCFVILGLLMFPWVGDHLGRWFPAFFLNRITDQDVILATVLTVGGVILVYGSYQGMYYIVWRKGFLRKGYDHVAVIPPIRFGLSRSRLLAVSIGVSVYIIYYLLQGNVRVFSDLIDSLMVRNPSGIIDARRYIGSDYLYIVMVYNVLPFLSVCLWCWYRVTRTLVWGIFSGGYCIVTALLLLATFQKRPIMVFLGCLLFATVWISVLRSTGVNERVRGWALQGRMRYSAVMGMVAMFTFLLVLYYYHTLIGSGGAGFVETSVDLIEVTVVRIFGRLSIPSTLYVHMFPNVLPHYGLTNLNLLSVIFGFDVFLDTTAVYPYFTMAGEGSVAVSSLVDFYGAFGWSGWFLGAIIMGGFLALLDFSLSKLEPSIGRGVVTIFLFVFVFYLSQASLARALLGYGGVYFVGLWLVVQRGSVASRISSKTRRALGAIRANKEVGVRGFRSRQIPG